MAQLCIIPARVLADATLTVTQLKALLAVGCFTDRTGGGVWASNAKLADRAGLDKRDLRRALSQLEDAGYIRRTRRTGPAGGDFTSAIEVVLDDPVGGEEGMGTPPGGGDRIPSGGEGTTTPPRGGPQPLRGRGQEPPRRRGPQPLQSSQNIIPEEQHTAADAAVRPRRGAQPSRGAVDLGLSEADLADLDWLDAPAPAPAPAPAVAVLAPPAELTDPVHRAAWEGIVRSAPAPVAVAASIGALASGLHGPGGRAVPWPVIGQALLELQAAAVPFSPAALRAFARRLEAPEPPPRVATPRYGVPATGPREETWDDVMARYQAKWDAEEAAERAAAAAAPAAAPLVASLSERMALPPARGSRHVA